MNIEDQVVSCDLAQRLKELGLPQVSYFYWNVTRKGFQYLYHIPEPKDLDKINDILCMYSAYTMSELGQFLPKLQIIESNTTYMGEFQTVFSYHFPHEDPYIIREDGSKVFDFSRQLPSSMKVFSDRKECDARAKAIIYLLENRIMDLEFNLIEKGVL